MSELADIRALLAEQGRSLGRIEGALAAVSSSAELDRADRTVLDGRVRKLEQRQYWYAGFAAAVAAVISAALGLYRKSAV